MTPSIFYINLDARDDRRAFMERQLTALGLSATRVRAVEAAEIPPWILDTHGNPRRPRFQEPRPLACALSHIEVWRRFAASGDSHALVLEDDVLLSRGLPDFLGKVPEGFDLVRIEAVGRRARLLPPLQRLDDGRSVRRFRSALIGSAGYVISAAAARVLLERQDEVLARPIDFALTSQMHEPGRSLDVVLVDPALCVQLMYVGASDVARSDIVHQAPRPATAAARLQRRVVDFWGGAVNLADNLAWLPRGARRGRVPFDGQAILPEPPDGE